MMPTHRVTYEVVEELPPGTPRPGNRTRMECELELRGAPPGMEADQPPLWHAEGDDVVVTAEFKHAAALGWIRERVIPAGWPRPPREEALAEALREALDEWASAASCFHEERHGEPGTLPQRIAELRKLIEEG